MLCALPGDKTPSVSGVLGEEAMKGARILWIVPLGLSSLLQSQVQVAANSRIYQVGCPAVSSELVKRAIATTASTSPAAFFPGSEVASKLAAGGAIDDGRLAAYQAISAARARIQSNGACRKFFHGEGEQVLDKTRFTLQYLEIPDIAAQVDGSVVLLNRSSNSLFMKPPPSFMGLEDPREIRAFYILHELAHELCRYTRYVTDHSASAETSKFRTLMNNELLFQNCYKNPRPVIAAR